MDPDKKNSGRVSLCVLLTSLLLANCTSEVTYTDLRIYSSPYESVDWTGVQRLKAQHHDHTGGTGTTRILGYDAAGYDVLSLMDYSGNASLDYAWQQRIWPPEQWVPAWVLSSLTNIKFFIPNAEEVGNVQHATSPFLTVYVEGVAPSPGVIRKDFQYTSIPQLFELIRANGGFPCLAHAWSRSYENLRGAYCTEIYTAFAEARKHAGRSFFVSRDQNAVLLANWDRALNSNQQVYGISVNDHYGPYRSTESVPDEVRDSGKIIVLAETSTPEGYRTAFEGGSFFAVRDSGAVKDEYPHIFSISVDQEAAFVETTGNVRWISGGKTIVSNPVLVRSELPPNARYVRAEIRGTDGNTVVYTQAFVVRPVGDVDGDYDIDEQDDNICWNVANDVETNGLRIAACEAR